MGYLIPIISNLDVILVGVAISTFGAAGIVYFLIIQSRGSTKISGKALQPEPEKVLQVLKLYIEKQDPGKIKVIALRSLRPNLPLITITEKNAVFHLQQLIRCLMDLTEDVHTPDEEKELIFETLEHIPLLKVITDMGSGPTKRRNKHG